MPGHAGAGFDRYGGVRAIRGKRTGWFHVEEMEGRWFFVTPEGNAFFSLGVTHAAECIRRDERSLFVSRYGGSETRLSEFFLARFQEWGYNSAGYGPLPAMETKFPYVATIWTEGPRSFSAGVQSDNTDIFDPAVRERLRRTVREAAARHAGNPFCLGYVFIDLPVWDPAFRGADGQGSYVDFMRALPASAPGRRAYEEFRARRATGGLAASDEAFVNEIAESYYACAGGGTASGRPQPPCFG
ncbi:MAG: hypothetical protein IPJ98_21990 [Bryobacterales bacterium]|nr:hypothetical protein [Bryobacterales bacterium]